MINDTLSYAIDEIERYQQSLPQCYDGLRVEIGKVIAVMNSLRAWLDCPPSDGVYPKHEAAKERLMAELARLDVEPLLVAVANIRVSWPTEEEAEAAKKRKKGQAAKKRKKGKAEETASSDDGSDNGVTNKGTHRRPGSTGQGPPHEKSQTGACETADRET